MTANSNSHLPGYDQWKLAEPPEGVRRCECGCDLDEHTGVDEAAMYESLVAIRKIVRTHRPLPRPGCRRGATARRRLGRRLAHRTARRTSADVLEQVDLGLNICACGRCCEFRPRDPKDDGDAACDAARET